MPNPIAVLPDPVLAVLEYLRSITALTTLVPADHILTEVDSVSPTYPYVLVQLGGGSGIWPSIDNPSIQIDVVGGTKFECSRITRTVRAAIWAIANDIVEVGTLSSGEDEMAPAWLPDTIEIPPLPRFVARYRVILHA